MRELTNKDGIPQDGVYYADVETLLAVKVFIGKITVSGDDAGTLCMHAIPETKFGEHFEDYCEDRRGVLSSLPDGEHRVAYWYMNCYPENEGAELFIAELNELWDIFDVLHVIPTKKENTA